MFETAGALAIVEPHAQLAWLVALPAICALVAAATSVVRARARSPQQVVWASSLGRFVAGLSVLGGGGAVLVGALAAARLARLGPRYVLVHHVGQLARIGQLDVAFDLVLDAPSVVLAIGTTLVGLAAAIVEAARPGGPDLSRVAWTGVGASGALLAGVGDGWPVLLVGLGISTLALVRVSRGIGPRALAAAVSADAAVALAAVVLFWGLGGRFGPHGYSPDLAPRFALVATGAPAPPARATVSISAYGGATVRVEGAGRDGPPMQSPFTVALEPGVVSFRVEAGAAAGDLAVTHVSLAPGQAYALVPYGSTVSLRNLADQLAAPRPTAVALSEVGPSLRERTLFGLPVVSVVMLLLLSGGVLRLVGVAAARSGAGLAPVLAALPAVPVVVRLGTTLDLPDTARSFGALAGSLAALGLSSWAVAQSTAPRALNAALAAVVAVALAAAFLWEPSTAVLLTVSGSLGTAAALASVHLGGDVRWLGVAGAAIAGILPGGGTSLGWGAIATATLARASAGASSSLVACALLLVSASVTSFAVFHAYGASLRSIADRGGRGIARAVSPVLGALALGMGAVLGAGTAPFGGRVAPIGRRILGDAAPATPTLGIAGLVVVTAAAALGFALARRASSGARPAWLTGLTAPARAVHRAAGALGELFVFLADSVVVTDVAILDDAGRVLATGIARVAQRAAELEIAVTRRVDVVLDSVRRHARARLGLDHPRLAERVREVVLAAMVALLVVVVLSSLLLG